MRHHQSSRWHQDIDETASKFTPTSLSPYNDRRIVQLYFPLAELQAHTELYLKKKGNLSPDDRERRLIALVKGHAKKDVAIAACAHGLSRTSVRDLLYAEFKVEPGEILGALPYLRAITAAHYANPNAVSEVEANFAQSLLLLSSFQDPAVGQYLATFFSDLSRGEPPEFLLRPFVEEILNAACRTFATRLDSLKHEGLWKRAREESFWLTDCIAEIPKTKSLLDSTLPNWRVWAFWRPKFDRLCLWESMLERERKEMRDILALEGPDFTGRGMPTLREGIIPLNDSQACPTIGHGRFAVKPENGSGSGARIALDRLFDALDTACSSSPDAIILFIHTSIRGPIDAQAIQLLELVVRLRTPYVGSSVFKILTAESNTVKASAALQLLPSLEADEHHLLREILTPHIVEPIEEEVARTQTRFFEQLQSGRNVEGMVTKLLDFGAALKQAPWLQPLLSDQLRSQLDILPEKKDVLLLLELRSDIQSTSSNANSSLPGMIDAHLRRCLTGHGSPHDEVGGTIKGLLHFWKQPRNSHQRNVAVAVVERRDISDELRGRCLAQLDRMHEDFVYGVGLMVRKDTDVTCINFARLLASEKSIDAEIFRCWRDLLLCMIKQRGTTLLYYTLTHLKISSWFEWLNDLKCIFDGTDRDGLPSVVLQSLHPWNETLSSTYLPLLTQLESDIGSIAGLRWILTGEEDSSVILPALHILQRSGKDSTQGARVLMKLIAPDGSNGGEIFEVLSRLNRTTPMGTQAYSRVLKVYQNLAIETAEAILTVWLQSSDLTAADKSAIEAMAKILGMRTSNNNTIEVNLQDTAVNLESEYSDLVEEADRLETIRLSLRADNAPRTSALLARIGIEDLPTTGDVQSDVPADLIDMVERIGEGEYEMSFLLTHLKPLNRTALGVGNARILLVRLILPNGNQPPRFCVHLYPEQNDASSNGSTRDHTYHVFTPGGQAPDMHLCHGKANRATYQLGRALWRSFNSGLRSLEQIYNSLASQINNMAQSCIVCGNPLQARLWRSTTCWQACSNMLKRSSLEVRLADIRIDPPVVDLLLSAVQAVVAGRPQLATQLLVECPVKDVTYLCQLLATIPRPSTLQSRQDLTSEVRTLGPNVDTLLSWLCTSYRGFLATPTEALKIPSMPGVHQFVLANPAPELEQNFAMHLRGGSATSVVFHGTSIDRLYSILCQGITIQSGGPLERHGAVMGQGVYVADEPSMSLGYASRIPSTVSLYARSGWGSNAFRDTRVLLACELAGHSNSTRGSHVITDPTRIMVRYVFLFPPNVSAPMAAHVAPALASAYATLRSGLG